MSNHNDFAERLVTTAIPVVSDKSTVGEVMNLLKSRVSKFETINYIYVINDENALCGVLSVRELLLLDKDSSISSHMVTKLVTARPHTRQERVAQLALKSSLKAIPVVTKNNVFLGVISSDRILNILNQEHTEDVLRFAGVRHKHDEVDVTKALLDESSFSHVKRRLPWLTLGLLGGILAAVVVEKFEVTLASQLILAAFIPAIVYMADAVGSQTQMLFIRALSINQNVPLRKYLVRELSVNSILGVLLAVFIFGASFWWHESILISSILGLSIFLTVCFTVIIAIILPWFFHVRGQDPAVASGPLATVLRDIVSLCVYLGVATALL